MSTYRTRTDGGAETRPRRSILALGALSLAGFATIWACGGSSGDTPPITPPAPTPTIAISNSAAISGQQGTTQTSTITLTRGGNYTGAVTLAASGAPAGVTVTLNPSTLSGSTITSTLSAVIAGTATPTAAGSITVTATGSGVSSATAAVPVTVTAAPAADFTLSPATVNATVVQGQSSAATAFTLARLNGYASDVTLAATGLPTGVTVAFTQPGTGSAGSVVFTALTTAGTGTYPITITASGANTAAKTATVSLVVQATPTVVLGLTPPSLSLAQGASGQTAITITRTNITGDVTLSAENVPQGVTATFTPTATSGTTSALALAVGGSVTPGNYTITVRGTAAGATAGTATVSLAVTAAQSYSLIATGASVQQGNSGTSTISITRTGGFAGAVTLAASNLPNGVTAAFSPNGTTGNSSTLTFTATGSATPGTFSVTVTGTAAGVANVTTTASVTVIAGGGGGSGNINWTFCETARFPLWFAVQNGTSGSWTRVNPTGSINRVYTFTIDTRGGVAYAIPRSGGGTDVTVQYLTQAEIASGGTSECVSNRPTKTLTGTVANLPVGSFGYVGIGGAQASVNGPATAYSIENVDDGTTDVAAIRTTLSGFSLVPDRGVLRRNVNYPAGGSVPVVDFTGSESFAIASADYTVTNPGSDQVVTTASIITANGVSGIFSFPTLTGGSQKVYGVPFARTVVGDLHQVLVIGFSGTGLSTSTRAVAQYNRELINRSITLGPTLSTPTATSLGTSPYVRFSIGGPWQSEYADAIGVGFTQQTTGSNSWTINASRNYIGSGASTWSLAMPDFSGVAGFSNTWAMAAASTNWSLSAFGGVLAGAGNGALGLGENSTFRFGARTGTVSP